jgi:two-component system, NarL family, nitrate/nitrite response regulator NarL
MHRVSDVRKVVKSALRTPVVIFSGNASDEKVSDALSQGAKGFIPKVVPLRDLSTAIELVAAGGSLVPMDFARKANPARRAKPAFLSSLELDVLHVIPLGQTNKLIAFEHELSESTTRMQVRRICQELEARSRAQADVRDKELCHI